MRNIMLMIGSLLIMSSCYNKHEPLSAEEPENLIHRDTIVLILADVEIAEAALRHKQNFGHEIGDQNEVYFLTIFKKYNITKAQYDSSMAYYKSDIESLNLIYEDVITRLSLMQTEANMKEE